MLLPPRTQQSIEIIPDRLYFSAQRVMPKSTRNAYYFSVDSNQEFQYQPFYYDFGPPSLLQIHKFNALVDSLLQKHSEQVHYTCSTHHAHLSNGVMFMASYLMIRLNKTPEESYEPFKHIGATLKPYRDASTLPSTFDLTVLSCLKGLHKAMQLRWYEPEKFDPRDWQTYEQVENGDMNWLIPGKLLAFATAYDTDNLQGWKVATPKVLLPVFKARGITCVVRLCQRFYNETVFTRGGIKHVEMYFLDGSTPPLEIRERFLSLIEGPDVIALHCKAGLGRTGTLAGCYMIKNYGFTAHEVIGWIRICRPGSVIGPQQKYLSVYEQGLAKKAKPPPPKEDSSDDCHVPTKVVLPQSTTTPRKHVTTASPPTPVRRTTKTSMASATPSTPERKSTRSMASTPISRKDEGGLHVQSLSLTPTHCPQPRKYRMAAHQTRQSTRERP